MAVLTTNGVRFAVGDELNSRRGIFPLSTAWVFYESAAPTGWTKSTAHDNKALRVVSGNGGGSAGTNAFTTTMSSFNLSGPLSSSNATGPTAVSTPQIAVHAHPVGGVVLNAVPALFNPDGAFTGWNGGDVRRPAPGQSGPWVRFTASVGDAGGNIGHSHPFSATGTINTPVSIAVQYVDVIVCTFNG
jgi:hypothetical protein